MDFEVFRTAFFGTLFNPITWLVMGVAVFWLKRLWIMLVLSLVLAILMSFGLQMFLLVPVDEQGPHLFGRCLGTASFTLLSYYAGQGIKLWSDRYEARRRGLDC